MQHPGVGRSRELLSSLKGQRQGTPGRAAVAFNRRRDKCPTILFFLCLPIPCTLGIQWPCPGGSWQVREAIDQLTQTSRSGWSVERGGGCQIENVHMGSKGCSFFKNFNTFGKFAYEKCCSNFLLPMSSLREVHSPILQPILGTVNLTSAAGSFSTGGSLSNATQRSPP